MRKTGLHYCAEDQKGDMGCIDSWRLILSLSQFQCHLIGTVDQGQR